MPDGNGPGQGSLWAWIPGTFSWNTRAELVRVTHKCLALVQSPGTAAVAWMFAACIWQPNDFDQISANTVLLNVLGPWGVVGEALAANISKAVAYCKWSTLR